jgi:hypothetical protein
MTVANYVFQSFYGSPVPSYQTVQDFMAYTVKLGREHQLDAYNANTAIIEIRYYDFFNYDTTLALGTSVRIYDDARDVTLFEGRIRDVRIELGIPVRLNVLPGVDVGNADRMFITAETNFADFGRMAGDDYVMAAGTLKDQLDAATTETGITILRPNDETTTAMKGTTITGTWGDWLNKVCTTLNARLRQAAALRIVSKFDIAALSVAFDETSGASKQFYNGIDFDSLSDNFYNQVIVKPEGLADQTSSGTPFTSGAKFRTLTLNTLNATTGQAQDFADYLRGNYETPSFEVSSITATSQQQGTNFKLDNFGLATPTSTSSLIGRQTTVTNRGATYPVIIEGLTVSGVPGSHTFTFYLSGVDQNAYLILDNAIFGTLDSNKLGY